MASADLREELTCSICLSIYTDPVNLSCGHNFCLGCIESVLGTQEGSGVYTCPECRETFNTKPKLQRNITLCNIVRNLHPTQLKKRETGIFCTYCIHSPVPAAKSCLHCEASLCDAHLRVHSKSEEHVLTEPTTSWGNRRCSKHKELIKYFCTEDAACICASCSLVGKHRGHQVELLKEASEKKKKKLRNVLQKLTKKREKTEKRVQSLRKSRRWVQEKAAGVKERLTALIRDIRKQQQYLEKQLLSNITRQQVLLRISDLIQQLEKEKDELTRKICHIEKLCNMTDPLTVLQEKESHRRDFHFHFLALDTNMASADLREELTCSICLSIYTDPVTLSCGHNFCLGCIESVLGTQEGSGVYTCPECRKSFSNRPELQRNITLCNIVNHLHPNQPEQINNAIFCTYCVHSSVPAAKSCLLCEASLCDTHLSVHSKSEEHDLTEPTTSWGNRKCTIHKELLKYFCTEDAACICVSCSLVGEHRGHQVELLNEAFEKKKKKLRNVLQKLSTKREETEKRVQSLQKHRRGVQDKAACVTDQLTALISDIKEELEDLEKRILSEITWQQEQVLLTISDLIQQLEKEKDELTRKICHTEELYNMTDPLTVLQEQESHRDDFCGAENEDIEVTQRGDNRFLLGGDFDEGLISVTLYRGLADIVTDVKRRLYMQVTSDILLDINTAAINVTVSGDLKSASWSDIGEQQPETAERFTDYPQVLSARSFTSGRHYWEVETSVLGSWSVGVCYPSMERGGHQSLIGDNNKSWCLSKYYENDKDDVEHDTINIQFSDHLSCDRVGILLDYEAGRLTFYELCDPIRHLHTFTATFTEPLHAAFLVWRDGARVRIMS
ncbi:LOW QUALITY PROTEIN: E3 ubiquitin/ISG15 ligase TRIM25-like [Bombina bombina]|uniref:LOW QUALITY PROTEIN: E3 ubiquitin/ISG15 ligase TRIM25-like n=1 Tax=Bombina bombina TaxID=8345 RepID=UPI00235AD77E|nr:LOW QUALITY PROTEIN: E3 ubiquitin/ISG15 ligase TRIM25-like [Bombina bombina]